MDDLISRQAAIDAVRELYIRSPKINNDIVYDMAIDQAHDALVNLPSAWIPCSERLPENTEPVNITWVNRKPVSYYADIKDKPYTGTGIYCNGKWWWYSVTCQDYLDEYGKSPGDDMDEAIEVLAWMPLPEPYQINIEEKTNERKKGKWEMKWHPFFHIEVPMCSVCKNLAACKIEVCPHCGADLREEKDNAKVH